MSLFPLPCSLPPSNALPLSVVLLLPLCPPSPSQLELPTPNYQPRDFDPARAWPQDEGADELTKLISANRLHSLQSLSIEGSPTRLTDKSVLPLRRAWKVPGVNPPSTPEVGCDAPKSGGARTDSVVAFEARGGGVKSERVTRQPPSESSCACCVLLLFCVPFGLQAQALHRSFAAACANRRCGHAAGGSEARGAAQAPCHGQASPLSQEPRTQDFPVDSEFFLGGGVGTCRRVGIQSMLKRGGDGCCTAQGTLTRARGTVYRCVAAFVSL
eukprot:1664218-Rhodomonas_salina.1